MQRSEIPEQWHYEAPDFAALHPGYTPRGILGQPTPNRENSHTAEVASHLISLTGQLPLADHHVFFP